MASRAVHVKEGAGPEMKTLGGVVQRSEVRKRGGRIGRVGEVTGLVEGLDLVLRRPPVGMGAVEL